MTTRNRSDHLGSHDSQNHLRYVEVYTIDDDQDVEGATNATPIVITVTGHGFATGDEVRVTGVGGNTAANGLWTITVTGSNTFELDDSSGSGPYTSGGKVNYQQPVRVKLLKWNDTSGGSYGTFGDALRVGDHHTPDDVDTEDRLWITWRRDSQRWEVVTGAGGGEEIDRCVGKADGAISAATDDMSGNRTPGTGTIEIVKGSGSDTVENWSLVEISDGSYVICMDIDGDMVVVDAFC